MTTAWLVTALVLLVAVAPPLVVCMRGDPPDRLVGLEMLSALESLLLVTLAHGFHKDFLYDLALALALLSFGASLVFARFLERWL